MRPERCKKYVNLVDLVKSFPTISYLQKSASIQTRTGLLNFAGIGYEVSTHPPHALSGQPAESVPRRPQPRTTERVLPEAKKKLAEQHGLDPADIDTIDFHYCRTGFARDLVPPPNSRQMSKNAEK